MSKLNLFQDMKTKFICFLFIFIFISLPIFVSADGIVIKPLPEGDWSLAEENTQQAFINYQDGIEKLIIAVDFEEENLGAVWITPVPGKPQEIEIDIISELPNFFGVDVVSKAKINLEESISSAYSGGIYGQFWTFPFLVLFTTAGRRISKGALGDLVLMETHIEKEGMIAEVITTKTGQALYDYLAGKGLDIEEGSISVLNSYIGKDYSFVIAWISSPSSTIAQRGVFITFPTTKIYYPLIPTSAYGEKEIPIVIRILGHVQPEIFPEIKPYVETSYFIKRTLSRSRPIASPVCLSNLSHIRSTLELYQEEHGTYPSSLQELSKEWEGTGELIARMDKWCPSPPLYSSKDNNEYTIEILGIGDGKVYVVDSSGFSGEKEMDEKKYAPSRKLQEFYGGREVWKANDEYTKIVINAPVKLFKKDLWIKEGRPLKISLALVVANHPLVFTVFFYFFYVGIISFFVGGIVGLICFRKFKKYALVGLGNVATLIGLIAVMLFVKKKEQSKCSKARFVALFSGIFVVVNIILYLFLEFSF